MSAVIRRHLGPYRVLEHLGRGREGRNEPPGKDHLNRCDRNCQDLPHPVWGDHPWDDGYAETAPVGSYLLGVSPYGALNIAGNVKEWVADWYSVDYYRESEPENPEGPPSGSGHEAWFSCSSGPYVESFHVLL